MLKIFSDTTLCDDFDQDFENIFSHYSYDAKDLLESNYLLIKKRLHCNKTDDMCRVCIDKFNERTNRL